MKSTGLDVYSLQRLAHSSEFKQIAELSRPSTTILGILEDAFHENVLSRMLRYLCSTSENHGLGDRFVREWFKHIVGGPFRLGKRKCRVDARFGWHVKTRSGQARYIDLVLVISTPPDSFPIAVIGVETKIQAREGKSQIKDYQEALSRRFRRVGKRGLLYLTPDGKPNQRASSVSDCPCHDVSYDSLLMACRSLLKSDRQPAALAGTQTVRILRDLSDFLRDDLMRKRRTSKIQDLVKKLESRKSTANAVKILRAGKHRPTIRSLVYEQILPSIRRDFSSVEIAWHYPRPSARPQEFTFEDKDITNALPKSAKYRIYFMLRSEMQEPDSGDLIAVLLMLDPGTKKPSGRMRSRFTPLREFLPEPEGELRDWGAWLCLWASAEYRLGKLGNYDAEQLRELYKRTVNMTKVPLLKMLKTIRMGKH